MEKKMETTVVYSGSKRASGRIAINTKDHLIAAMQLEMVVVTSSGCPG